MITPSSIIGLAICVLEDEEFRAAVRAFREATAPAPAPMKTADLTRRELAAALGVSVATITRARIAPTRFIGRSPRFDLDDARAKFEVRGPLATTPKRRQCKDVDLDVSGALTSAGLRSRGHAS